MRSGTRSPRARPEKRGGASWRPDLNSARALRREGGHRSNSCIRAKEERGGNIEYGLAFVIHELATNSAKYGALSLASGTLDVSCNANDDEVVVTWTERGGHPIAAPVSLNRGVS